MAAFLLRPLWKPIFSGLGVFDGQPGSRQNTKKYSMIGVGSYLRPSVARLLVGRDEVLEEAVRQILGSRGRRRPLKPYFLRLKSISSKASLPLLVN